MVRYSARKFRSVRCATSGTISDLCRRIRDGHALAVQRSAGGIGCPPMPSTRRRGSGPSTDGAEIDPHVGDVDADYPTPAGREPLSATRRFGNSSRPPAQSTATATIDHREGAINFPTAAAQFAAQPDFARFVSTPTNCVTPRSPARPDAIPVAIDRSTRCRLRCNPGHPRCSPRGRSPPDANRRL